MIACCFVGLQSVSSSGLIQNGPQMDNASASGHGSISAVKKRTELCAFCKTPGRFLILISIFNGCLTGFKLDTCQVFFFCTSLVSLIFHSQ